MNRWVIGECEQTHHFGHGSGSIKYSMPPSPPTPPPTKKNAPRFLDYRRNPLPLDVAVALSSLADDALPKCYINGASFSSLSSRQLILSGKVLVNGTTECSCHRLVCRYQDKIEVSFCTADGDNEDNNNICNDEDGDEKNQLQKTPIFTTARLRIAYPRYFICYKPRGVVCSNLRNEGIDREDVVLISDWLSNIDLPFSSSSSSGVCSFLDKVNCGSSDDDCNVFENECGRNDVWSISPIQTVGRLDEQSEGLLFLTNDGSFSRLLCDPDFGLQKTYRVVVRGSGYGRIMMSLSNRTHCTEAVEEECGCFAEGDAGDRRWNETVYHRSFADLIVEMIECGNRVPTATSVTSQKAYFPFENCTVLDAGRLPTQHSSDDSYFALIDIVLREGKRHAVRRIIKNANLRVCFLSRIAVEGLLMDIAYNVVKPQSLNEAQAMGFLLPVDGGGGGDQREGYRRRKVPVMKIVSRCGRCSNQHHVVSDDVLNGYDAAAHCSILHPGYLMELNGCDVDRIFALRNVRSG